MQRCLPSSFQAPAFPAATNFCNSTIDNNLRNARKSSLPSAEFTPTPVQRATGCLYTQTRGSLQTFECKNTYLHRPTANGTEGVSSYTEATERCAMAGGDTIAHDSPLSAYCCIHLLHTSLPTAAFTSCTPLCLPLYSPPTYSARNQLAQIPVAKRERRDDWKAVREALCRVQRNSPRKVRR